MDLKNSHNPKRQHGVGNLPEASDIGPFNVVDATIVFIGAVADAASGTLRVRVELANKDNRPSGEHVRVSFPASQSKVE